MLEKTKTPNKRQFYEKNISTEYLFNFFWQVFAAVIPRWSTFYINFFEDYQITVFYFRRYICSIAIRFNIQFWFRINKQHIWPRLTIPSVATSFYPRYTPWSFDNLTNIAAKHGHINIIFFRVLTAASDKCGGLGVFDKGDSDLLE